MCALLLSNAAPTSILNCFNCGVYHGLFLLIVQVGLIGHALLRAFVKTLVSLSTIWFSFFSVMVWVWFHLGFFLTLLQIVPNRFLLVAVSGFQLLLCR